MRYAESDTVELKSEVVSDLCKEIIAFANTKGGTLYIGVADDGTVIGIDHTDKVMLQINNMVRDSIKPDITMFVGYEVKRIDEKQIIAVTVQKGTDRPYYLAGKGLRPSGVYVRNGTSADPATDTAIRKMIKETDGDSFESMRSLEQSLSFKSAEEEFSKRNVQLNQAKMQTLGLVSKDGIYSNAALLLSDQCGSTVKAAVFSGSDKSSFQNRREFSGSLFRQMEELYTYLDLNNKLRATFEGLYRKDRRDYPEEALREALFNSFVHRDYSISASTLVSIFDDRIEFVSAGGLPEGIEIDDIMLGLSVCRNPKLAAVFYRLELIEAYGTGIPKIMKAYSGYLVKPRIEATSNAFKITLPNCNADNNVQYLSDKVAAYGNPENIYKKAEGSKNQNNTVRKSYEDRILTLIHEKGEIVRSEIDALLGVSQTTASRILKQMVESGIISQEGRGKTTRFKDGASRRG